MILAGQIGRLEVGFDGGDGSFDFVRSVGDENLLRFVGFANWAYGLLGEEVREDNDNNFKGNASDNEGEEKLVERGFSVGKDAFF